MTFLRKFNRGDWAPIDGYHTHVWRFEETSGANCASAFGGTTVVAQGVEGTAFVRGSKPPQVGKIGLFLRANAATDCAYAVAGSPIMDSAATDGTLEVICVPTDPYTGNYQIPMSICTGTTNSEFYVGTTNASPGTWRGGLNISGSEVNTGGTALAATAYKIHHIALVWATGNTMTMYINGETWANVYSGSKSPASMSAIVFGNAEYSGARNAYPFRGWILEGRYSNIARSHAYIRQASTYALAL